MMEIHKKKSRSYYSSSRTLVFGIFSALLIGSLAALFVGCQASSRLAQTLPPSPETRPTHEPKHPISRLPSKALILGVPYVSWREAAQWRYEHKDILNPSSVAAFKMIQRYWGQDRPSFFQLFGKEEYLPEGWKDIQPEKGQGLADLKTWIARGVPVNVRLMFTPYAHPLYPLLMVLYRNLERDLPQPGPSSGMLGRWTSWEHLSGVLPADKQKFAKFTFLRESLLVKSRVVIGYDDERRVMIMHDPSFGPTWEMSYDEFEANWRLNGYEYFAHPPKGYADFVANRPTQQAYPPRTPDMRAAVHYVYGYALSQVGRTSEAALELEKGLAIPGVGNGYRHLLAWELAYRRKAVGRLEDAVALLIQAIEALPEAPEPLTLLKEIYKENPSLPGAQQAVELERNWRARFDSSEGLSVVLRTIPQDFYIQRLGRLRGWACNRDYRASRC